MNPQFNLLLIWILNALALLAVANFVPGIHVDGFGAALIAAFFLGLVNTLIRPLLLLLTLPVTLLTLGLFIFVINGTAVLVGRFGAARICRRQFLARRTGRGAVQYLFLGAVFGCRTIDEAKQMMRTA